MTSKGGDILEQAKKRDHKIVITDVAIEKVPYIEVTGLSNDVCKAIQDEHKEILRIAKAKNDSNEVLTIMTADGLEKIRIFGDEFEVNPSNEPKAIVIFNQAKRREIMYLHNHPSTNSFSLADIDTFISEGKIGLLSVVTNQGEAYILYKTIQYDYASVRRLLIDLYNNCNGDADIMLNKFLKKCEKVGIIYAKSKQ